MKPGPKPRARISAVWSTELAYAVGLLAADGYVSKDGRHINLTSKDVAQIELFSKCLGLRAYLNNSLPMDCLRNFIHPVGIEIGS